MQDDGVLGRNIQRLREEKGITQKMLASEIGINRASLSLLENGKRELKVGELVAIAKVLRVGVEDVINGKKPVIDPLEWKIKTFYSSFEDGAAYLVKWIDPNGIPSLVEVAYWSAKRNHFFLDRLTIDYPIHVDEYMKFIYEEK